MRRLRPFAVAAALLAASLAARSAGAQERDAREGAAKKACLGGKPERGIELLAELYAETNDPTYIYNQGRCFEQNGKPGDALTRFREYLRKAPHLGADERAQVQEHISEMEAQARQAAPPPVVAPTPVPPPAPAVNGDRSHQLRVAAIVTAGVGVVLVATGAYFGARTQALSDEVTADAKKGVFSQSKYDEGQRDQLLQWIGVGVGAAAVVGGGLLYFLGVNRAAEPGALTAMPTFAPGSAGASLRVTF